MSRRFRRRAGFIIIFGTRGRATAEAIPPVEMNCPSCRKNSRIVGKVYRPWFTLFFIPLFPIGGGQRFSECTLCGAQFGVPIEDVQREASAPDPRAYQQAIELFNRLRDQPDDPVLMNRVLEAYLALGEYREAIQAGERFPRAVERSDTCRIALGRAYLGANDRAKALAQFDAVLAHNPNAGDAHFFKAIAYWTMTPPDRTDARKSALRAKDLRHPEADRLLREIEAG